MKDWIKNGSITRQVYSRTVFLSNFLNFLDYFLQFPRINLKTLMFVYLFCIFFKHDFLKDYEKYFFLDFFLVIMKCVFFLYYKKRPIP